MKVKANVESSFDLTEAKNMLKDSLKKIFRIGQMSVLYVGSSECQVYSTIESMRTINDKPILSELTRLSDSLEAGKAVDITKQASKYPNLQTSLKNHMHNFCLKLKKEHFDEILTLIYVFHVDFTSLKILFEK